MATDKNNYKYLVSLYSRIGEYLSTEPIDVDTLPEMIVSFCVVTERMLKAKLYRKNPILVFDSSKIKEDSALTAVTLGKEDNIETIKIRQMTERLKLVFKTFLSESELQALVDIYDIRNRLVHGYKPDSKVDYSHDDVLNKMGTIWEKLAPLATTLFGKNTIKRSRPIKKYTEEELESVLIDEVRQKIKSNSHGIGMLDVTTYDIPNQVWGAQGWDGLNYLRKQETCPRCGSGTFSLEANGVDSYNPFYEDLVFKNYLHGSRVGSSGLYKCSKCHLELTPKEYAIAKDLKSFPRA